MPEIALYVAALCLLIAVAVYANIERRRQRARMTPEQKHRSDAHERDEARLW